ncbi:allantoinase AllB [bacterium LRH843]|nr:allantoinase AllB [bacterium LRH843]
MDEELCQKFDLVISGGTVVLENGTIQASVGVKDGKIAAISNDNLTFKSDKVLDVTNKVVFPGLIDPHVHLWDPGFQNFREDFNHGTQAAAAGGVSTIIEMPLSDPPVIDKESFNLKLETASKNSVVDFALWGGLIPKSIDNLEELHKLGCVAFKAFISYATKVYPHTPDFELWKAMKTVSKFGGLVGVHAENADIAEFNTREMIEKGIKDPEAHSDSRPEIAELESIQKAILFAEDTGCNLYIVHISTGKGIELVNQAKARGINVLSETCPHYLLFDRSALKKYGAFIKCNPPLRSKDTMDELWEQVLQGNVDCIGSDHGPYTDEEKMEHSDNILKAPSGFAGIEVILPILISEGFHKRNLKLEIIANMTSTNVAKSFGIYPQKGSIRVGSDADFAIVDLNEEWTYLATKTLSKTKSEYSPYHNMKFKGRVESTIVRGTVVYDKKDLIQVKQGFGKFITASQS